MRGRVSQNKNQGAGEVVPDLASTTDGAGVLWIARTSIILLCIVGYLPAIDNSFISDDFTLLRFLRELDANPSAIWGAASEFFRSVSYVYFWLAFRLFGLRPEFYYLSGIALHIAASLAAFALVRAVTGRTITAWVAAVFFAVYARHEEAVMWISANNSTILTLNCLLFLTLWERHLTGERPRWVHAGAVVMFVVALFSKESAVALLPLAAFRVAVHRPVAEVVRKLWPLAAICAGFISLWLSQSGRNFFVADGHYAIGMHFPTVYSRSLLSLLSSALPFIGAVAFAWWWNRRSGAGALPKVFSTPTALFFLSWIFLSMIPVSFQTYSKYIASRNTYFPSVALAALVGILFTFLLDNARSPRFKAAFALMLMAVLAFNGQYLWRKQDPQYTKRAAPTRELIAVLNGSDFDGKPLHVCGFPLHESIGSAAVAEMTRLPEGSVVFTRECGPNDVPFARWQANELQYSTVSAAAADTIVPAN